MKPIFSLLAALWGTAAALGTEDWQKQSIYQVITDRFAQPSGAKASSCTDRSYCGGTWNGITEKLDYIQGMGFTAIWISPTVENIEADPVLG